MLGSASRCGKARCVGGLGTVRCRRLILVAPPIPHMEPTTEIPTVNRVEIDSEKIREFSKEHEFTGLAVELLIEAGSYVCIGASILPPSPHRWNRHEAVVIGHLVRLYKLTSAMLDQTCQHRRETTFIFGRLAFECIVNTLFLIKNDKPEIASSYIEYSMRHEKRLRDRILSNIETRGGEVLHIEQRMLRSIKSSAKRSGVDLDLIKPPTNWGGKNLFEKAKDVGLEEAYLGAFAGPSHAVHGNWQDLLEYHLDSDEDGYTADLDWHRPRPQLLTTLAHLIAETLSVFFSEVLGELGDELAEKVSDLQERVGQLVYLHEEFLAQRLKPT